MQLIKIPTTSYVNATLKRWGHDFTRNSEGKYSNPWANRVKPNVKGKTHKAINYPFCLLCPIIYFFQKWLSWLMHGDGKSMTVKFEFGKPPIFEKCVFDLWGKKIPQNAAQPIMHSHPSSPHAVESCWSLSFMFSVITFISMAGKTCFCFVDWICRRDSRYEGL